MCRAIRILSIIAALCISGAAAQASIAQVWEQCGGTSCSMAGGCADAPWDNVKCAAGLKCFRQSAYYHQCRAVARLYNQCGGTSCENKGVCGDRVWAACLDDKATCTRKNEYYWQCLPSGAASPEKLQVASAAGGIRPASLASVPATKHARPAALKGTKSKATVARRPAAAAQRSKQA